jgi:hypothetical protein
VAIYLRNAKVDTNDASGELNWATMYTKRNFLVVFDKDLEHNSKNIQKRIRFFGLTYTVKQNMKTNSNLMLGLEQKIQ